MKLFYDLHIHSVLSPCSDILMTPNNLLNMSNLKGLDIIAITDHNSLKQLKIIDEISKSYQILLIYGVEICLKNESHVLCYFKTLEDAMRFDSILEDYLIKEPYDVGKLGEQIITDNEDSSIAVIPYYLNKPLNLTMDSLIGILEPFEHLRFFAHIDRDQNSGLQDVNKYVMNGIECTKNVKKDFLKQYHLEDQVILYNSDAHQLTEIQERDAKNAIHLPKCSMDAFFGYFKRG